MLDMRHNMDMTRLGALPEEVRLRLGKKYTEAWRLLTEEDGGRSIHAAYVEPADYFPEEIRRKMKVGEFAETDGN